MIKQLAHINIGAFDLDACENFYCNILGLEKTFEFVRDGEVIGFYLGSGNMTFVEVFRLQGDGSPEGALLRHFCLEVEDIDAVIASIRAKGGEISDKAWGADNAWQAWTKDPSGVAIELMQYTPESSQYTGKKCVLD
jgi:glyoxylase I family protein